MIRMVDAIELSRNEFEVAAATEFEFLVRDHGFDGPTTWEFADTLYCSFERGDAYVRTWCGKRESDIWTVIERVDLGRLIALDTLAALRGDDRYPPFMGTRWSCPDFADRLRLEAGLLREHLPAVLDAAGEPLLNDFGSEAHAEAIAVDSPYALFARRCRERLSFLEDELGLDRELTEMGSGYLYRGARTSVRVVLMEVAYEQEDEAAPTVTAEILDTSTGAIPPLHFDSEEVEIADRDGPFSPDYLERALDDVERGLRRLLG
jgi:hypothetical protein